MSGADLLGIECLHHYGITTHAFRDGQTVAETVYWLIRNAWHREGLTDDNHTWVVIENEAPRWSRILIKKNENSPPFALRPSWVSDGPGANWFSQEYRAATLTNIAWEVAGKLAFADRCEAEAGRQRDTIRGRKLRQKQVSLAVSARREAELIRSRWPEFAGLERTGWQARMHEHLVPSPSFESHAASDASSPASAQPFTASDAGSDEGRGR